VCLCLWQPRLAQPVDGGHRCTRTHSGRRLDPYSQHFHPTAARSCLQLAVHYTPAFGDTALERLRLELLVCTKPLAAGTLAKEVWPAAWLDCLNADPTYGGLWLHLRTGVHTTAVAVYEAATPIVFRHVERHRGAYVRAIKRFLTQAPQEALFQGPVAHIDQPATLERLRQCVMAGTSDSCSRDSPTVEAIQGDLFLDLVTRYLPRDESDRERHRCIYDRDPIFY
jgi:hypothetical protein